MMRRNQALDRSFSEHLDDTLAECARMVVDKGHEKARQVFPEVFTHLEVDSCVPCSRDWRYYILEFGGNK